MSFTIEHKQRDDIGMFYIGEYHDRLGEMTYRLADKELMIIDHTLVDDELRGQGAGKQLVAAGVEFARANNYKIRPLCVFAKSVFDKTPEYIDVLE